MAADLAEHHIVAPSGGHHSQPLDIARYLDGCNPGRAIPNLMSDEG